MMQWTAPEAVAYLMQIRLREEEPAKAFDLEARQHQEFVVGGEGGLPSWSDVSEEIRIRLEGGMGKENWRATPDPASRRVYACWEERVLSTECRAFLDELSALDILDAPQRECVIERVLALDLPDLEPEDLCWIVLGVLNATPDPEEAESVQKGHPLFWDSDERH